MRKWLSLYATLLAAGCGGSSKKEAPLPPAEAHEDPPNETGSGGGDDEEEVQIEGLLGQIDLTEVQPVFEAHWDSVESCYRSVGKNRFVQGHVELKFRIGTDGTVRHVQVADGDLGSWPVEKCVLGVARGLTFPRPKGGEAEFRFPIDFPGRGSVMTLAQPSADMELQPKLPELSECAEGSFPPGKVAIIVYMGPGGVVKSAGFVAPEDPFDDVWADCAMEKALAWKLTDPRGKIVKALSWYAP